MSLTQPPYSGTSCAVVSLVSTSLMWSDQTCTPIASASAASPHIHVQYGFHHVGWAYFRVIK